MRKILSTITVILIIILIGILAYIKISDERNSNQNNTNSNSSEQQTTPTSGAVTATLTPEATITPEPAKVSDLFPAYQYLDGAKMYGYIDGSGKFVIQPTFTAASDFTDGAAVVQDAEGYKVIDLGGNVLFQSKDVINNYSNGVAAFAQTDNNQTLMGYLDTKGTVIIKPQYMNAGDFGKNGKALVTITEGSVEVIDKNGLIISKAIPDLKGVQFTNYVDGYIFVTNSEGYNGVLDSSGKTILKPEFGSLRYLGHDLFAGKKPADFDAFITNPEAIFDKNGTQLTDYSLYNLSPFNGGYASVTDDTYTYFIGTDGKEAASLPKVDGIGTLTMIGDIVKADIDGDLAYMNKDQTILWKADSTASLASGITVKKVKLRPNKYDLVKYPVVEGLTDQSVQKNINDKLMDIFTSQRKDLKEEDKLSVDDDFVATLLGKVLIIKKTGYDYNFGAAHGMPIQNYYFINTTNGSFYQLSDLLKKDSHYVSIINKIINKQIKDGNDRGEYMPDSFKTISDEQYFYITKDSIVIYFYPYDIAAYAYGFPEFKISYTELKDVIDTDGEFWKAFQ